MWQHRCSDIPWFHGIINTFSLSLVCERPFCANFDISFSLFCRKSVQSWMRRFWAKNCRRDHLQSLWRSIVLVTVHRWQRSAAAEGRRGSLIKCGITKLVTIRRVSDGPSYRFIVKFREVIPVPRFQELKCFRTKILDGPLCLWRSVILAVNGNEESSRRIAQVWDDGVHDGPSWPRRPFARSVDPVEFWQISSK